MSFGHRDILGLAETLCKGSTEAEFRSSVSRSYYAAYHHIHSLVDGHMTEHNYEKMGAHKRFWNDLVKHGQENKQSSYKSSAYILKAMLMLRRDADYKLEMPGFDAKCAETALEMAKRIQKHADAIQYHITSDSKSA